MNRGRLLLILQLLLLGVSSACGERSATSEVPALSVGTSEPSPRAPTPLPGRGVVTGTLLSSSSNRSIPATHLFLAKLSPASGSISIQVAVMDPYSSPRAVTDSSGAFTFVDVEPGAYTVVCWSPSGSTLIRNLETDKDLSLVVAAGQIVDLGVIYSPAGY